jgi:ribosomal protein S4
MSQDFGPVLCFSLFCVRVRVGFEPRKLQNKQMKISTKKKKKKKTKNKKKQKQKKNKQKKKQKKKQNKTKNPRLFMEFFKSYCNCKGLVMLSINLVIMFYFTIC